MGEGDVIFFGGFRVHGVDIRMRSLQLFDQNLNVSLYKQEA